MLPEVMLYLQIRILTSTAYMFLHVLTRVTGRHIDVPTQSSEVSFCKACRKA